MTRIFSAAFALFAVSLLLFGCTGTESAAGGEGAQESGASQQEASGAGAGQAAGEGNASQDAGDGAAADGGAGQASGEEDEAQACTGTSFYTVNGVTKACVDGRMIGTCGTEGEVYKYSKFLQSKVVCEGGLWVEKDLEPGDPEYEEPGADAEYEGCTGKSSSTIGDVTQVCINGSWETDCDTEGEVYSESEFLKKKVVCENGKWVSKPLE